VNRFIGRVQSASVLKQEAGLHSWAWDSGDEGKTGLDFSSGEARL